MKVFISWSGETSQAIAEVLKGWLPSVIQAIKPYYSPNDIAKGTRWSTEIAKELEECKIGLLCLTPDNLEAPWIMFEAGALSKSLSAARVCPLLFGIEPSYIKGPLVQFQAARFTKEEMKKAIRMMNKALGVDALADDVLEDAFEIRWPNLEDKIKKAIEIAQPSAKQPVRSDRDILEEILARVRAGSFPSRDKAEQRRRTNAQLAMNLARARTLLDENPSPAVRRQIAAELGVPLDTLESHVRQWEAKVIDELEKVDR